MSKQTSSRYQDILEMVQDHIPTARIYHDTRRDKQNNGIVIFICHSWCLRMYFINGMMLTSLRLRPRELGVHFIPSYGWKSMKHGEKLSDRECAKKLILEYRRCRSFIPPDEFQKDTEATMEIRKEKKGMVQHWVPDPQVLYVERFGNKDDPARPKPKNKIYEYKN